MEPPRRCGLKPSAGDLLLDTPAVRPNRTNWLTVGTMLLLWIGLVRAQRPRARLLPALGGDDDAGDRSARFARRLARACRAFRSGYRMLGCMLFGMRHTRCRSRHPAAHYKG